MTREIKFRAWDKKFKEMHFTTAGDGGVCLGLHKNKKGQFDDDGCKQKPRCKENNDFIGFVSECDRLIYMQFTGLHDKNKKEYYDGDIFKAPSEFTDNGFEIVEVYWNDKSLAWYGRSEDSDDELVAFEIDKSEIVGDIYTTPELLKGVLNVNR